MYEPVRHTWFSRPLTRAFTLNLAFTSFLHKPWPTNARAITPINTAFKDESMSNDSTSFHSVVMNDDGGYDALSKLLYSDVFNIAETVYMRYNTVKL